MPGEDIWVWTGYKLNELNRANAGGQSHQRAGRWQICAGSERPGAYLARQQPVVHHLR